MRDLPGVNIRIVQPGAISPRGWVELPRHEQNFEKIDLALMRTGGVELYPMHPNALANATIVHGRLHLNDFANREWPEWQHAIVFGRKSQIMKVRGPGGRKQQWEWDSLRLKFIEQCAHKGWPDETDNAWPTQGKAESWLRDQSRFAHESYTATEKSSGKEVSESRSREMISAWMKGRQLP